MLRRYSPNEHVSVKLFQREVNSNCYEKNYKTFKCEIIDDINYQQFEIIEGTTATRSSLKIKSSNCPFDIKQGDKIEVLGVSRVVTFVGIRIDELDDLIDDKFDNEEIVKLAPKIIGLGN